MTPTPAPNVILTGITGNWTRVRPSIMRGVLPSLEYGEARCYGLILDLSVGHGRSWAKIGWTAFQKLNMTRRRAEQCINVLLGEELILRRKPASGSGWEYQVVARPEGELTGLAKCRNCSQVGEIDLDSEFIPVPHSFFVSLPLACTSTQWLIVMAVVVRTVRWREKQMAIIPCEITIEDFERATGKKRSEICQDLVKVQAAGYEFIGSEKVGRTNRYWARPENFAKAPARAAREVKQPKTRTKSETDKPKKVSQPIESQHSIRPVEFATAPCGVCRNCHCYGPVDIVPESAKPVKNPIQQARAGPIEQIRSSIPEWKGFKKA